MRQRTSTQRTSRVTAFGAGNRLAANQRIQDKEGIGGPLGDAPHEVGKPFAAVRYVDPHPVSLLAQVLLFLLTHAVQHLELVTLVTPPEPLRLALNVSDHRWIMSGHAGVVPGFQESSRKSLVAGVDVGLP